MHRTPIIPSPSRIIYLKNGYRPSMSRAMLLLSIFILLVSCLAVLGFTKITLDQQATQTAIQQAVEHQYQTLTAEPTSTSTSTLTPTVTPTITPTSTPLPTSTPTPAFVWKESIPDNSAKNGPFVSLGRSDSGVFVLAYILDAVDDIKVIVQSGNSWKTMPGLAQLNEEGRIVGLYLSMDVAPDGTPFLAYLVADKDLVRHAYLISDNSWNTSTVGRKLSVNALTIKTDKGFTPHFAYLSQSGEIFYQNNQMSRMIIDSNANSYDPNLVSFKNFPITMALDDNNIPTICYAKQNLLRCAQLSGSSWKITDVAENGVHPSLKIDQNGNYHLAYYDTQKKSLMYAYLNNALGNWEIYPVDDSTNVGINPSLAVDTKNIVHISYYDADNHRLKYATGNNKTWSIFIPDSSKDETGILSSLCLNENGDPVIAYYDQTLKRIKMTFWINQ